MVEHSSMVFISKFQVHLDDYGILTVVCRVPVFGGETVPRLQIVSSRLRLRNHDDLLLPDNGDALFI